MRTMRASMGSSFGGRAAEGLPEVQERVLEHSSTYRPAQGRTALEEEQGQQDHYLMGKRSDRNLSVGAYCLPSQALVSTIGGAPLCLWG